MFVVAYADKRTRKPLLPFYSLSLSFKHTRCRGSRLPPASRAEITLKTQHSVLTKSKKPLKRKKRDRIGQAVVLPHECLNTQSSTAQDAYSEDTGQNTTEDREPSQDKVEVNKKEPGSQQQTGQEETKEAQNADRTEERTEEGTEETTEDQNEETTQERTEDQNEERAQEQNEERTEEQNEERTEEQNEERTEDRNDDQKRATSRINPKKTMDKMEQHKQSKSDYRQCKAGLRNFKIKITRKEWKKIKPKHHHSQLRHPWTEILYDQFNKINPCCTLSFKYQHVKLSSSRKKTCPFFIARAKCTFNGCNAIYTFRKKNIPKPFDSKISFIVKRLGSVTHRKKEWRFRPAKYLKRGKIAKAVADGVSKYYNSKLRQTPIQEITAGNITKSLTKDVLRKISSELKKSTRLHDDIILELVLTQKLIKETSINSNSKGYFQQLHIDPFAVHLQTDTGLQILAHHLRNSSPVTLHLDATGSVVQKIPGQEKKNSVLCYGFARDGEGQTSFAHN
ncbi:uncharacterized protein LOC107834332 [Poecilia formosa]|uniref:uncharacterized protein LOC107834332 n=1 Tax=Poecilia formosa TaxID=48698 RepID=UPI0007B9E80C|nr:PREDICTED: uncharacterized protein LOC107834332 [Poecilia formosa]